MSRSIKRCLTATVTSVFVLSAGSIAFVRPAHAALWEYRFTGVFYSDSEGTGDGIGVGIFDGIDGANPQGASFTFSAMFDDSQFTYRPPLSIGTVEWFDFPVIAATITRETQSVSLQSGLLQIERETSHSYGTYVWFAGTSAGSFGFGGVVIDVSQLSSPLPSFPSQFAFAGFSGGIGKGNISQTGAASLRYRFNDASLTLVPAPAAAPLLALAGLTVRGRRRR